MDWQYGWPPDDGENWAVFLSVGGAVWHRERTWEATLLGDFWVLTDGECFAVWNNGKLEKATGSEIAVFNERTVAERALAQADL